MQRVTEIFGIIIGSVRDLSVLKDKLYPVFVSDIVRSVDHQTERKLMANIITLMITLRKCIQLFFGQMIAERRIIAGLVLFKITPFKQRICHAFPIIGGQSMLRKETGKVSLRKQDFFLSGNSVCVLTVNDRLLMGSQEVCNIRFLQCIMQNLIIRLNILSRESFVNTVDLSSCNIAHEHCRNSGPLFIGKVVLRKEVRKLHTAVKARLCFKHIGQLAVFAVSFSRCLSDICVHKRKHLTELCFIVSAVKEISKVKLHILNGKTVNYV